MPDSEAGDEPDQGIDIARWEVVGREKVAKQEIEPRSLRIQQQRPKPLGYWTYNG